MAELAWQLGKIVEHLNQIQPNPFDRPPVQPCTLNNFKSSSPEVFAYSLLWCRKKLDQKWFECQNAAK